jgi:hypothetical protein
LLNIERPLLKTGDEPVIREITTRMSRFVLALDAPGEREKEAAYIVETETPVVITRYTPDKVGAEKNVYLITALEKSGSKIFLAPGVITPVMFIRVNGGEKTALEVRKALGDYFTARIKGAYTDGNDLLINRKKVTGFTVIYRVDSRMLMAAYMFTIKAAHVAAMTTGADFEGCKYTGIAGVCDETGLSENDVRAMVEESVSMVMNWRPAGDTE